MMRQLKPLKKLAEKYKALLKCHAKVRLMFQDEASFGRINKPKRCWCVAGIRPVIPCHHVREYTYAYGAVSPLDGEIVSLVLPYANTACMNIFLDEAASRYSDEYILMVMDNAAWHKSKTLVLPGNIEIFPLPAYTPELNPIEMIWDDIREKGFRNELFQTLQAVGLRLCDVLLALEAAPSRVSSITYWPWIRALLNAD